MMRTRPAPRGIHLQRQRLFQRQRGQRDEHVLAIRHLVPRVGRLRGPQLQHLEAQQLRLELLRKPLDDRDVAELLGEGLVAVRLAPLEVERVEVLQDEEAPPRLLGVAPREGLLRERKNLADDAPVGALLLGKDERVVEPLRVNRRLRGRRQQEVGHVVRREARRRAPSVARDAEGVARRGDGRLRAALHVFMEALEHVAVDGIRRPSSTAVALAPQAQRPKVTTEPAIHTILPGTLTQHLRQRALRHRQAEKMMPRCARLDVVGLGRPEPRADGLTAKPDGLETAAVAH